MTKSILRPDGFALGLFAVGVMLLILPLMLMPGLIAILMSAAYWLVMVAVKVMHVRRTRKPRL